MDTRERVTRDDEIARLRRELAEAKKNSTSDSRSKTKGSEKSSIVRSSSIEKSPSPRTRGMDREIDQLKRKTDSSSRSRSKTQEDDLRRLQKELDAKRTRSREKRDTRTTPTSERKDSKVSRRSPATSEELSSRRKESSRTSPRSKGDSKIDKYKELLDSRSRMSSERSSSRSEERSSRTKPSIESLRESLSKERSRSGSGSRDRDGDCISLEDGYSRERSSRSRSRVSDSLESLEYSERAEGPGDTLRSYDARISLLRKELNESTPTYRDPKDEDDLKRLRREISEMKSMEKEIGLEELSLKKKKDKVRERMEERDRGVDVCIMMDCTASMWSWIDICKKKIVAISDEVQMRFRKRDKEREAEGRGRGKSRFRFAFIGYRDHCDGDERIEYIDFTEDVEEVKKLVDTMKATGGGDAPEDIAGALKQANRLSWKYNTKLVIHIADAPCHGKKYHDFSDDYPEGDPDGIVPEDIFESFASKFIDYYFVRIHPYTDTMIDIFKKAYYKKHYKNNIFKQYDVGDDSAKFPAIIISSIQRSSIMNFGAVIDL